MIPLEDTQLVNEIGSIDSKFRYIIVAAKRTRQLQGGARPFISSSSGKLTKIAQEETSLGLIQFEIITSVDEWKDENDESVTELTN